MRPQFQTPVLPKQTTKTKNQLISSVEVDVEKLEHSYTAGWECNV
jgi:hypothetical protein